MHTDHVNSTLSPLFSSFMQYLTVPPPLLIFWLQCVSYHIWKCTQTMQTLLHHCQQWCILFFLIFWVYLHQLPYREMCTDHVINASRLLKESTSCLFFFSLFFLIFLLYLHELPYQEMGTDHVNNTPTLLKMVYVMLFYSFLMFWAYLHQLPYQEMCTDHVNSTSTLLTTVYIMSILFFLSFSDFLLIFLLITILGNVHAPCK